MSILVTGARGMVGTALVNNLKIIRDNKNRTIGIYVRGFRVKEWIYWKTT